MKINLHVDQMLDYEFIVDLLVGTLPLLIYPIKYGGSVSQRGGGKRAFNEGEGVEHI